MHSIHKYLLKWLNKSRVMYYPLKYKTNKMYFELLEFSHCKLLLVIITLSWGIYIYIYIHNYIYIYVSWGIYVLSNIYIAYVQCHHLNILIENLQKYSPYKKAASQIEHCLLQKCTFIHLSNSYKFDSLFITTEKAKPNKYVNHCIN